MRILQIAPRYAPAWAFGGGVRITYELARKWVQNGHQVTVFTSDQKDARERFAERVETIDGIEIHRFRNPAHVLASRYSFLFFYPLGLVDALRRVRGKFDVMHVAEARGRHCQWALRELPSHGIPIVWSAYGGLAQGEGIRRLYRRCYDAWFGSRKMVRGAAALVAQTRHEAQVYQEFGADPERVHLIPLAINWSDFAQPPARGGFRARLGLKSSDQLVLFVGRVHWTKGLQVLLPAFARVSREFLNAKLVIVGWDHGYMTAAKTMAAALGIGGRVLFPGAVFGAERFQAYVDADLFALTPGVYEETSLAALEACAMGVGCVITRQCEIPGLDAACAGITVDYEVDAVVAGLRAGLLKDCSVRWGKNARQMVQDGFTIDRVARLHEKLFLSSAAHGCLCGS